MSTARLKLGVNIDHVATLRQARGVNYPSIIEAGRSCEAAGADGITVHLREDRRHIQDGDVYGLRQVLGIPLNLEMAVAPQIVKIAVDVKPHEVCLVPEKREELTTEGGLDAAANQAAVADTVRTLSKAGIIVSLFIDPDPAQIEAAVAVEAPCVELHTGSYCNALEGDRPDEAEQELQRLIGGARLAHAKGLQVNAGHGLNLDNIDDCLRVPFMDTLNIGHSIVAHAVFVGLTLAVKAMLARLDTYSGGTDG